MLPKTKNVTAGDNTTDCWKANQTQPFASRNEKKIKILYKFLMYRAWATIGSEVAPPNKTISSIMLECGNQNLEICRASLIIMHYQHQVSSSCPQIKHTLFYHKNNPNKLSKFYLLLTFHLSLSLSLSLSVKYFNISP